jgi:ADP-ribose diphosphatase
MSDILAQKKVVFQGRVFTVSVDRVTYPDGRTVNMEVVRHPGSVVLIPAPAPARVVLVRQYRYVVEKWLWELPAGPRRPRCGNVTKK